MVVWALTMKMLQKLIDEVEVMAWCLMLTQIYVVIWPNKATMSYVEYWICCLPNMGQYPCYVILAGANQ